MLSEGSSLVAIDEVVPLRQRIVTLEADLAAARHKISELEQARGGAAEAVGDAGVPISEFEETLKRLVQRIAMILQAEKCVIMIRDRETGDLFARSPAFGMSDEDVKAYRVHPDVGISGAVFRSGEPIIFDGADQDARAKEELLPLRRVRNGVTVPLMIEKRDELNRVSDRIMVGVLHCFNKRYAGEFIEEDVRLLERLARNTASVIANAQMFQEVVKEKEKLVHTLESLTAGLLLINQHGRIGQMNAQARAMFEVPKGTDPVGHMLDEFVKEEKTLRVLQDQLAEADNPEPPTTGANDDEDSVRKPSEITILDEEGEEYIYQVHAASVRGDDEAPIGTVVIFNDITDIRNVERMKTEFVSVVSHELRTPLTPMKGFVRTLLDDENEEWYTRDDRREFYGIIETNVDRLSRLINDLLNVSRIERGAGLQMNFEDVDLRKATEEVVDTQKGMTDRHTLVIDFEPETIVAETDVDKIQNILQNLVSNAIKYSPGGEVRVIGRLEPTTQSVLMGVRDQGSGISEVAQKKLFTKFYRVHTQQSAKVGGTGLGLYLVKHLVESHHGQIWVESEVNKGSTFWFRFPLHQPKEQGEQCGSTVVQL
jgi:two-component system phosphate regulon sensor histidine kinase PhoR